MQEEEFFRQIGTGVASLTFGVALSIFIYAAASGLVNSAQTALLYVTSFLLMLRFWWRYTELFVRFLPSRNFWHFLLDFAISFFGILAVLLVQNIQAWAAAGAAAMIASIVRCALSMKGVRSDEGAALKRTLYGAAGMLVVMGAIYFLAAAIYQLYLSAGIFVLVLAFVVYASYKK